MFDPDEPRSKPHVRYVKPTLRGLRRSDTSPLTADDDDDPVEPPKTEVALRNGNSIATIKHSIGDLAPIKLARVKQIEAATDKIVAETELLMAQAEKEMAGVKQIHAEIADARQAVRRKAEKEEVNSEADELTKQERSEVRNLSFLCASISILFLGISIVMLAHGNPAFAMPSGIFVAFIGIALKLGFSLAPKPDRGDD